MSFLRALRKLLLGETVVLPIGLSLVFAGATVVRPLSDHCPEFGGFAVLAGVAVVLVTSVHVTGRRAR